MLNTGDPFGRFTIRARLGDNAIATVYRAYDTQLKREIALKVLRATAGANPDPYFAGTTPDAIRAAHWIGPACPRRRPDPVPPGVDAVLRPALAADPAQRTPASAGALVAALQALAEPSRRSPWRLDVITTYRGTGEDEPHRGGTLDRARDLAERLAEQIIRRSEATTAAEPPEPPSAQAGEPPEPLPPEPAMPLPVAPAPIMLQPPTPQPTPPEREALPPAVLGSTPAYVEQQRRVDAAVPSVVGLGQSIRMIAQVRFHDSPALGIDDWPTQVCPEALDRGAERMGLMVTRRSKRPVLVILNACRSAGDGYGPGLFALGPQLATAGVSAVIAFQGDVRVGTVAR